MCRYATTNLICKELGIPTDETCILAYRFPESMVFGVISEGPDTTPGIDDLSTHAGFASLLQFHEAVMAMKKVPVCWRQAPFVVPTASGSLPQMWKEP